MVDWMRWAFRIIGDGRRVFQPPRPANPIAEPALRFPSRRAAVSIGGD
jgi:hypothetical protein